MIDFLDGLWQRYGLSAFDIFEDLFLNLRGVSGRRARNVKEVG